jgi:hypothetical protein
MKSVADSEDSCQTQRSDSKKSRNRTPIRLLCLSGPTDCRGNDGVLADIPGVANLRIDRWLCNGSTPLTANEFT